MVLGHAFVGWATAAWSLPRESATAARHIPGWRLPAFIVLAYLPDIAGRLGMMAGYRAVPYTHSLGFALAAAAGAAVLAGPLGVSRGRAATLALLSLVLHDALDLTQTGDRLVLWPFYGGAIGPDRPFIERSMRSELAMFGALTGAVLLWQHLTGTARRASAPALVSWRQRSSVVGAAIALLVVGAAGVTHKVRDLREEHLWRAMRLLSAHDYAGALARLDAAERLPSLGRRARIAYLKGEAFAGLGNREQAEQHYLAADALDPGYYWVVRDLAAFYAVSDLPQAERQRLAAPYLERLGRDFSDEPDLPRILAQVNRDLVARP